ncbi:Cytochrome P450 [Penicillium expansum]|uniref:Cytochrome P450 n=1 Tax=Penicillium expansum TaxID=27334 RepID=A0A0A2JF21_PENEN|nr:Cytochrome P450 [Penicillium expansum]KGO53238.1 Cytochrome P450 [Penicillium expansum]
MQTCSHNVQGPLVRIGPNEISFYSLDIYKRVHAAGSQFVKDPRVYSQFVQDGHPALFSITDPKEHAQRRRHMGVLFNRSKVPILTQMMVEEISRFNTLLGNLSQGSLDLIPTCRALEADIVSRFAFGNSIGAIESLKGGEELQIVKENDLKSSKMSLHTNFPSLMRMYEIIGEFTFRVTGWGGSSTSSKEFEDWASEQLKLAADSEKAPEVSFLKVMAGERISPESALSESKEMLGPGTDTTSATLAHILWALSLNQSLQDDLVSDLNAANWTTDMTELESIPRLTACVKEGIRWTGAASAMLPRIVPTGGSLLAGKQLPGGTMISSSPIWWLERDGEESATLRSNYYIPFSKGPSTCIGNHFAYLELYLSVSQILKKYRIQQPEESTINVDVEATLPPRLEWVAAVPTGKLQVVVSERIS